jgi:hypothetical protein
MATARFITVGEISRRLDVPVHRISYVLRTRRIKPEGWAGRAKVYSVDAMKAVDMALNSISHDRGGDI